MTPRIDAQIAIHHAQFLIIIHLLGCAVLCCWSTSTTPPIPLQSPTSGAFSWYTQADAYMQGQEKCTLSVNLHTKRASQTFSKLTNPKFLAPNVCVNLHTKRAPQARRLDESAGFSGFIVNLHRVRSAHPASDPPRAPRPPEEHCSGWTKRTLG